MIYVLAAIGALTVAALMWRAFGPVRDAASEGPRAPRRGPVAPDDDPGFLRELGEQQRRRNEDQD